MQGEMWVVEYLKLFLPSSLMDSLVGKTILCEEIIFTLPTFEGIILQFCICLVPLQFLNYLYAAFLLL